MGKIDEIRKNSGGTIPTTKAPKRHRSPKADPIFTRYWNKFLPEIETRENFKPGHLHQLEVLCDLYLEYSRLTDAVNSLGYTFDSSGGRNGDQIKIRPEVTQLNRCRAEIRSYSKMLGLLLYKDTEVGDDEEKNEWD